MFCFAIDILATAIRSELSVFDLEELELAYAPPYSSAKDPVNMAGFVAGNYLRGDTHFWYAEDLGQKIKEGSIVDVRTPTEYDFWHIPGAINVPVQQLRKKLDKLQKNNFVGVYCRVGIRSYRAYRILRLNGFINVATLAGGLLTFELIHENVRIQKSFVPETSYNIKDINEIISATGKVIKLDVSGLGCPGPLKVLVNTLDNLEVGDDVVITVTDPLFLSHLPSFCDSYHHLLINYNYVVGGKLQATIRKGYDYIA